MAAAIAVAYIAFASSVTGFAALLERSKCDRITGVLLLGAALGLVKATASLA